jgi:hypothetical protein
VKPHEQRISHQHRSSHSDAEIMVEDFPVVEDFHRDGVENLPRPEKAPR